MTRVRNINSFSATGIFLLSLFLFVQTTFAQPMWTWARNAHTINDEWANDVAVDPVSGDVVIVGTFNGGLSAFYGPYFFGAFGGGFIAKYDASGNVKWALPIGNNADDACNGVAIDGSGNIYVAGYVQSIAEVTGTSGPYAQVTSSGGKDIFLLKYNSAGVFQWGSTAGDVMDDEGIAVCVSTNGVYVTGYYMGNASFGSLLTASFGFGSDPKLFVASYNPSNGSANWVAEGVSGTEAYGTDICTDNTSLYVTGIFSGSALKIYDVLATPLLPSATLSNANPASFDAVTLSLSATLGAYSWSGLIQSTNDDNANGIAQSGNNVYVTGSVRGSAAFPGYGSNPVNASNTGADMYLAQLSKTNGNTNWVRTETSTNDDEGMSVTIDTSNTICVAGYFQNGLSFSGGPSISSSGNEDIYVASYNSTGSFNWVKQAGDNGRDIPYGITTNTSGDVYTTGEYQNNAAFDTNILTADAPGNIFLAKIGCTPISNNTITASQTICSGQTPATLNGNIPTGGSSVTYLWEQSADNFTWSAASGTNNAQNYSPPALTSTTYFHRLAISGSTCTGTVTSTSILITVDQNPTTAAAGSDQAICASTATLSASNPAIGNGTWSLIAGSGTFTAVNNPATTVNGLSPGSNTFVWTTSNGVCPNSTDTVSVKVYPPPTTANAGSNQTICANSSTLNANIPTTGTGTWSVISGGAVVTSPASANSGVTGLSAGTNVFQWTITNGSCPASTSTVSIRVDAPPTVSNAGSNQVHCGVGGSITLNGNNPAIGTGTWTVISGGGAITSPNSYSSTVTGMPAGTSVFQWSIGNGTCPASTSTVSIKTDAQPSTANAGINQNICATSATLNGNIPIVGTGNWSLVSGGGTISSPASFSTTVTGLSTGTNVFMWSITNGTCPASTSTVSVKVDAMPTSSNAGSNQTICSSSVTLSANTPSVGTGAWSVSSGGATVTTPSSNNSSATGLSAGANVFVWTISNGACPASSNSVTVNVDAMPTISNAGSSQNICASSSSLSANVPSAGTGSWSVVSGGATVTSPSSNNSAVNNLAIGSNVFMWTISNGTCPSSTSTVSIQVDAMPSTAITAANQTLCAVTTATLSATPPSTGNGIWSTISGTGSVTSNTSTTTSVSGLTTGTTIFMWTVSNGVCPASTATVSIKIDAMPSAANAGPDAILYSPSTNLAGNIPAIGSGVWSVVSGGASIANTANPVSGVSDLQFGQNIFQWTVSNGICPASVDEVIITVNELNIPNGFSPNDDNINDNFEVPGLTEYHNVKLQVFNRWGNLVFESNDYKNDWGGENMAGADLTDDTYYFILEIPGKKTYKGYLVLKRK